MIELFRKAWQKGLELEDYEASRWEGRFCGRKQPAVDSDALDLALTVCAMRYVSDLRIGRINPQHFYVRFEHRTQEVRSGAQEFARADDGEKLPVQPGTINPGQTYAGVSRLTRFLRLVGDLPIDRDIVPFVCVLSRAGRHPRFLGRLPMKRTAGGRSVRNSSSWIRTSPIPIREARASPTARTSAQTPDRRYRCRQPPGDRPGWKCRALPDAPVRPVARDEIQALPKPAQDSRTQVKSFDFPQGWREWLTLKSLHGYYRLA